MLLDFLTLVLASAASAAVLYRPDHDLHAEFWKTPMVKRALTGPISTDMTNGLTGGQVADGAPPVSSFFQGMKPPVSRTLS
jgi:hypothetical protein